MAWNLERVQPPWDPARRAIYEIIIEHLDDTGSLGADPPELPDELVDPTPPNRSYASEAAVDGTDAATPEEEIAAEIAGAVFRLAQRSTSRRAAHLYRAITRAGILEHTRRAFPYIQNAGHDPSTIAAIGRWLATRAPDRSAVTFGMVLLGMVQPTDTDVMLTLGAHHEFTFVASVALSSSRLGERGVWELAQRARGAGRVYALERLVGTTDPDIKRWMLTDGFRDGVGDDYLALACALAGDLAHALAANDIDDALLVSAGEMLAAIVDGRLHPGDYPDLVAALTAYLGHVTSRDGTPADRRAVGAIRRYLDGATDSDINEEDRARLVDVASAFLARPHPGAAGPDVTDPDEPNA